MVCIIPAEHSLPVLRGCSQNPQYSGTTLKAHPSGGMWVQAWSSKATNEARDASEADKHGFLRSRCVSRQSSLRLTWGRQHLSSSPGGAPCRPAGCGLASPRGTAYPGWACHWNLPKQHLEPERGQTRAPFKAAMWGHKRLSGSLRQRSCIGAENQGLFKILFGLFQHF